ncbi:unnamed protein product [Rotaria sordida]|uniref:Guanine nucleotide-binding protein subunit gamma n=1 Tax=Rotaria sordida TaxID=392033 RepID=A0A813VP40_9BILA|nr:unnamed protein product [Rotaria sordida]CAF1308568.1 unnamed protein product [Rotaria sordida]CAF3791590.1 unnamed protein product [Rotaria sordida]CAF3893914.1 unnamed protein product [Rotaria sordida]
MSTLTNKEKLVEQLQAERNIERIKVSMACKDLIQFCQDHQDGDALSSIISIEYLDSNEIIYYFDNTLASSVLERPDIENI